MIASLDTVLDHLIKTRVTRLRSGTPPTVVDEQVGFRPPDDNWRTHMNGLGTLSALNLYLLDLRDNRRLRTNERVRTFENGTARDEPAPARVDCHYLITAWSPATSDEDRVAAEHALLGQTIAVLMSSQPLVPRNVFDRSPLPTGFPVRLADAELPCQVLPPEGYPKLAEFWGTMGVNHRWKPAIYLIVTVPVLFDTMDAGPLVTTRITEYHVSGSQEPPDIWIQIAGTVRDQADRVVTGAWVRLETTSGDPLGAPIYTSSEGRFTFSGLARGQYQLHVVAPGSDVVRPIQVPSPGGSYDVRLP